MTRFYTVLPLSKERLLGKGYQYVNCGAYQLPLFEGTLPIEILSEPAPLRSLQKRLSEGLVKLSETGASILVRIKNPLIQVVTDISNYTGEGEEWKDNIRTHYLKDLVPPAAQLKFFFEKVPRKTSTSTVKIIKGGKASDADALEINKLVGRKLAEVTAINDAV